MNTFSGELLPRDILPLIHLDKSWEIRRVILRMRDDLASTDELKSLQVQPQMSHDLIALYRCAMSWIVEESPTFHVGESGTLYRILRFLTWKQGRDAAFETEGSLIERSENMCHNPEIVTWPQEKLLELDNGTSQWASAAAISGDPHRVNNPPFKLQVTYDALDAHESQTIAQRQDITIAQQAGAFLRWRDSGTMEFTGEQAEDYPFLRAFGLMEMSEGRDRWPALAMHESDRLEGFEKQIQLAESGQTITVNDHRPVMALAMRYGLGKERFLHPDSVNKTWPQFWDFIHYVRSI